jgi:hypothetical protein
MRQRIKNLEEGLLGLPVETTVGRVSILLAVALLLAPSGYAQAWKPVDDPEALEALFSETVIEATLGGGSKAVARYNRDGTGVLEARGDRFDRTWEIRGRDQVCIGLGQPVNCCRVERNADSQDDYRALNLSTGESLVFTVRPGEETIALAKAFSR